MNNRNIIFVPGKNPKPPPEQHRALLWRTLIEGVRRAAPGVDENMLQHESMFELIAWNWMYYGEEAKDISLDLPWIDALLNKHGPTPQDLKEARAWKLKLDRFFFTLADMFSFLIPLLPEPVRRTANETLRYFRNHDDIACNIRELLKQVLRPLLANGERVLLIGHSLGSVIAYDTLWELSHEEGLPGKVDLFLTIGSPLGMNYVQHRLMGHEQQGALRYPGNIRHWINMSSVGDVTALDRIFADDFSEMLELGLVDSIEDHAEGIYNFFRNDQGLNCHRSYGYLVNPAVGDVIANWWRKY